MNKTGIVLGLLLMTLSGFWVWTMLSVNQGTAKTEKIEDRQFTVQKDEAGDVVVEVRPVVLKGKEARFIIVMDTHNVELNYNLMEAANLNDGTGSSLKPVFWNGGSGGHHLKGELVFPPLADRAESAELLIAGISGFDRRFKWNL